MAKGRRRGTRRLGLGLVAAVAAMAALPIPVLSARPSGPSGLALERPVYPGYRFEMRYRHSTFDVPVTERFRIDLAGRLVLTEIQSTRADVIGYYHIPGAVTWSAPGEVRIDPPPLPRDRLRVLASPVGNRTLVAGGCAAPLTGLAGPAGAVTIEVRFRPAAAAAIRWRSFCPTRPASAPKPSRA